MEVATTNNHHQHHHHHHRHHHHHPAHQRTSQSQLSNQNSQLRPLLQQSKSQKPQNLSLIVTDTDISAGHGNGNGNDATSPHSPFQREVREWQRIDPDTGALHSGRLEADRWINGPLNSYGKISDSQNISQPNGTQHTQRKQLEVLQARTNNGGAMQVIRTQTVQTTSSRSWSSSNSNSASASASTSASASATASPISMGKQQQQQFLHAHSNHNHFHKKLQHLAETNTHWSQLPPPAIAATVDICEVSTDDGDNDDDDDIGEAHFSINATKSKRQSLNSNISTKTNANNYNSSSSASASALASAAPLLLPSTAPSLKLSNLLSNSGRTSNSSSNSSLSGSSTTATTTAHPHRCAGKLSRHTIVGDNGNTGTKSPTTTMKAAATTTSSTAASAAAQTTWPQQRNSRLLEQVTLYGKDGSSNNKVRVGAADCDDRFVAAAAASSDQETPSQPLRSATTPTQRRRDFESFRHYALPTAAAHDTVANKTAAATDDDDDVHDLRLSRSQLRRQQLPTVLHRSRSISNDDVSSEWHTPSISISPTDEDTSSPNDWCRVSKLRRSFQSSSNNANTSSTLSQQSPPHLRLRPTHALPTHSTLRSVSQIRADLEAGRRLNTAMRNNHIDIAALDSILQRSNNTRSEQKNSDSDAVKRDKFLTAASLKEIRGKLKKLSDESLYRDDFIAYQQPPAADEQIEVQQSVRPAPTITASTSAAQRLRQLSPDTSPGHATTPKSAFQAVAQRQHIVASGKASPTSSFLAQRAAHIGPKHATHSLESRQKFKDTNSSEWHLRRKSYGFEKMSPPEGKTMFRMDASTDSGLGRSGEQLGNWSPTEAAARGTVVHFGDDELSRNNNGAVRYRASKSPTRMPHVTAIADNDADTSEDGNLKRHSIAVDESQYVRDNLRKTSQVHLNGFNDASGLDGSKSLQLYEGDGPAGTSNSLYQRSQQQKRVEFCKTEVHFAAESGRVNIVETDGKPPPNNNFRRRRRTASGQLQSLVKSSGTPAASADQSGSVTHFGDDLHQRHRTIASSVVAYKATLVGEASDYTPESAANSTSVTVSVPKLRESHFSDSMRNSYASTTSGVDTTDNENDEIAAIRGILKNKPAKPKPYHLGENIESADALWGVQLKPVIGSSGSVSLPTTRREHDGSPTNNISHKSVAERVRIVENRHEHAGANGYSTKINLSMTDARTDWPETGAPLYMLTTHTTNSTTAIREIRRPSAQELLLQDLREHQRILDEGLKSTSLIIKTMRSANEFDEAMRRLSIASLEASVMLPIVVPTPMLRSNNYQETTTMTLRRLSTTSVESSRERCEIVTQRMTDETQSAFTTQQKPSVAPRLKLLGAVEVPVSQPLPQLRRLWGAQEYAIDDGLDSADEEVKSYFCGHDNDHQSDSGGGTLESSSQEDERGAECSNSWNRLKVKQNVLNIETEERNSKPLFLDRTDLPKSNVMSIELHSPQIPVEKRNSFKRAQTPPLAKPRTISNIKSINEQPQLHTNSAVKQHMEYNSSKTEPSKDALKIIKEARGARKLREHELSYFGVDNTKHDEPTTKYPPTGTNILSSTKRTLPSRKLHDEMPLHATETKNALESIAQTTNKWQLLNDKPDLLRHSPIAVEPQIICRNAELETARKKDLHNDGGEFNLEEDDDDEHYYENITNEITPVFKVKPPSSTTMMHSYDRRRDLERDAHILSEMNKSADQTLKALSDEAAIKNQRRRSLQRRSSKPLETIDEKTITEKINDTCIAVKVTRGTHASDAKRIVRHATPSPSSNQRTRTSSQSSVESCPRARSRSLSSEREYENIISMPKPTRSATAATKSSAKTNRSSSRESQRSARSQYSSGEEVSKEQQQRQRTKSKRTVGSSSDIRSKEREHKHQHREQEHGIRKEKEHRKPTTSSTAHASQREERVECTNGSSLSHSRTAHQQRSCSDRRKREEMPSHLSSSMRHRSSRSTAEKSDEKKHERTGSAGARLLRSLRGREKDTSTTQHRAESQRSKEHEREKSERDKQSRTRGHSSRVTSKVIATATHSHNNEDHVTKTLRAPSSDQKSARNTTTATSTGKTRTIQSKRAQNINPTIRSQGKHYHQHEPSTGMIRKSHERERERERDRITKQRK